MAWAVHRTAEERFADRFQELACDWIDRDDPSRGPGWDPYPTSLRLVNWICGMALIGDVLEERCRTQIWDSLCWQLKHLGARCEYHLLGNHLPKNYLLACPGRCGVFGPLPATLGPPMPAWPLESSARFARYSGLG